VANRPAYTGRRAIPISAGRDLRHHYFVFWRLHNDVLREKVIEDNVIRARGAGIVLVPGEGARAYARIVRHNAVSAARPVSPGFEAGNALETTHGE